MLLQYAQVCAALNGVSQTAFYQSFISCHSSVMYSVLNAFNRTPPETLVVSLLKEHAK